MNAPLAIAFMIIVALLYSALIMGAYWANNRVVPDSRTPVRILRFFVGGYLVLIGMLSLDRYFSNFYDTPLRLLLALVPPILGVGFLAFHPLTMKWVREIPQRWMIGLQTFRFLIAMEFFFMNRAGILPWILSLRGGNLDSFVGLSAPFIAWYVHRQHRKGLGSPRLLTIWNGVGLVVLTYSLVRALLHWPSLKIFDSPYIAMTFFPWIWMPTFVVPLAYLLHILSLRREWAFRKDEYKSRLATTP